MRHAKLIEGAQSLPHDWQRADDAEMANQIVRDQGPCRRQIAIAPQGREATAGCERVAGSHRRPHLIEQRRDIETLGLNQLVHTRQGRDEGEQVLATVDRLALGGR